ncbi:AAA family ATPase [Brevundimonas sp.]|uniref:nucleotide-binding protein n=1 Tax=Brevundimonas sp. TaxID=1871086 RepID=UPI0025E48487|nr:AAA family ATPase [Brevundimonas sp.]
MQTLAVLSRKGGTGKTTLATHLAVAAEAEKRRTLILDMDPQRSAIDWRRERPEHRVGPRVEQGRIGALFAARQAASRGETDLLMLDTRAGGESETCEAVRTADLCLLVVRPSFYDIRSIARSVEAVVNMRKRGLFVLNQAPARRNGEEPRSIRQALEQLADYGLPICPVGLRMRSAYQSASARGLAAQEAWPDSQAAFEVNSLWRVVRRELWPEAHARPVRAAARDPETDAPLDLALAG